VILRRLQLKNIRSYRDETIEFRDGITLFEGDIGSGKSSILNAVEFALFGLGDQNGSYLLRVGEKEGKVELTILVNDKEYTFGRGLVKKRNNVSQESCFISEGDTTTSYNATEMKRKALQILNFREPTNPRSQSVIYRYAVFTPQEQMREVIRLKPEARKETLRKALGIEEYSIAAGNATAVLTDLRSEVRVLDSSRTEAEQIHERIKSEESKTEEIKSKIKAAQRNFVDISSRKLRVKEELDSKKAEEEEHRQLNQRYQLLEQERRQLDSSIATNTKALGEAKAKLRSAEKAKENYENLSPKYEEYRQVKSDFPKLQRRNELYNSLKQKIEIIKTEVNSKRENLKTQLDAKEKEILDISGKIGVLDDKIAKLPELATWIIALESQAAGIESLRDDSVRNQSSQKVLQQEIKQLEAQKKEKQEEWSTVSSIGIGAMCPHCQQELSKTHYKLLETKIAGEVKGLDEQIHERRSTLTLINERVSEEKALLVELGRKEKTLNSLRIEQAELVKDKETHERYINDEVEAKRRKTELDMLLDNDSFAKAQSEEVRTLETEKNKLSDDVEKYGELRKKIDELESIQIESQYVQAKTIAERIPEHTSSYTALESEKGRLNEALQKNKEIIGSLVNELKRYEGLKELLSTLQETGEALLQEEATQNALIKAYNNDIKASDERVKDLQIDLSRHRENLIQAETLQIVEIWLRDILIPGFQAIEKNILMNLNQEFNKLFKRWFGNLIESEELQGTIDENFTPIVEQSGYELEVESLSGGEKTSVALAYRLALNTIVKQVTITMKNNLLILDEPTDGFSKEQLFKMRDILNELDCQQVILVSHEKELETVADNIYRVRKEGNTSTIIPPI
jgi:exonuclease SbcC